MAYIERNEHGVRKRNAGKGDAWAEAHKALGTEFHMTDIDAFFGMQVFGGNTGDRLFLEYVPDDYENHGKTVRRFGLIAMFDRKESRSLVKHEGSSVSLAFYLWLCRSLATESCRPRFFYVVGKQEPPWEITEVDIDTGMIVGDSLWIDGNEQERWNALWTALGLTDLREAMKAMVRRR